MISKTHGVAQNPPGDSSITELCCQGRFLAVLLNDFGLTTLKPQIFDVASLVRFAGMQQQRKLQIIITVAHCLLLAVGRLLHTPCLPSQVKLVWKVQFEAVFCPTGNYLWSGQVNTSQLQQLAVFLQELAQSLYKLQPRYSLSIIM